MLFVKSGIDIKKVRKIKFKRGIDNISEQVKKVLADADQKIILMVRG